MVASMPTAFFIPIYCEIFVGNTSKHFGKPEQVSVIINYIYKDIIT